MHRLVVPLVAEERVPDPVEVVEIDVVRVQLGELAFKPFAEPDVERVFRRENDLVPPAFERLSQGDLAEPVAIKIRGINVYAYPLDAG
jgi:hypothetical protein